MARVSRLEWLLTYLRTSQRAPMSSRMPTVARALRVDVSASEALPRKCALTRDEWLAIFQEAEAAAFRDAVSTSAASARAGPALGLESLRAKVEALACHVEQRAGQGALTTEQAVELRRHVRALQRAVTPVRRSRTQEGVAASRDAFSEKRERAEAEAEERSARSRVRFRTRESGEDDEGGSHEPH